MPPPPVATKNYVHRLNKAVTQPCLQPGWMKINQLFRKHVDYYMVLAVLRCFELYNLEDRTPFCKRDLVRIGTVDRISQLFGQLSEYYIPCKGRLYLIPGSLNKAITILKQLIALFNHHLVSREHTYGRHKMIVYHISNSLLHNGRVCHQHRCLVNVSFD